MHNIEKWPDILLKSCGVDTARFLKYVWSFFIIMFEMVNDDVCMYAGNYNTNRNKGDFTLGGIFALR